jgi:hypothetical protein
MQVIKQRINFLGWFLLGGLLLKGLMLPCFALEFEPRRWSHLPMNTNFGGVGYGYTEADILVNPATRLENVEMKLHTVAGKYIRTFELFDKSARIDIGQGYQEGDWTGLVDGVQASASRNGLADTMVRFAINLYGAPPLSGKEYVAYRSKVGVETIVGMGLVMRLPTGDYMDDKLINLGNNRFGFRPQIGVSHIRGKWTAELTADAAFFTENDEFWNGNTLEQDPLYIIRANFIHTFRPGLWASAGIGADYGGENSVNGIDSDNRMQEIGWAVALAYPINRRAGISVKYIGTRTQESTGVDTDTVTAGISFAW